MLTRRDFLHLMLYGTGCVALGATLCPPAFASDDDAGNDDDGNDDDTEDGYASDENDQEDALNARQSGKAIPTGELIALLKKKLRGEIIDIRMVNQYPPAYDVKMINPEGRIGTVRVAAKSFKILRVTGF